MPENGDERIVVDVHTHIFSARDIPFRGYLRSRRSYDIIERMIHTLFHYALVRCVRPDVPLPADHEPLPQRTACLLLGRPASKSQLRWANVLKKESPEIAEQMISDLGYSLFTPLMVDYEYWFENTKDCPIGEQADRIRKEVVIPNKGIIHPFISFCPARQLAYEKRDTVKNPDGKAEDISPLCLVKEAIENWGFIGVKLYNACGYRPLRNAEVEAERRKIPMHGKRGPYNIFTGADFDRVLKELYKYCEKSGVPITTHCQSSGVQAFKYSGRIFGAAKHWWPVLEEFKDLRLNLAHFGIHQGRSFLSKLGIGDNIKINLNDEEDDWALDISKKFGDYPGLYVDVAHHELDNKQKVAEFTKALAEIRTHYPLVAQRMMFGTDWHVFIRNQRYDRLHEDYPEMLRSAGFSNEAIHPQFLSGNAFDFLGMREGDQNRRRLQNFYNQHGIKPPRWFDVAKTRSLAV